MGGNTFNFIYQTLRKRLNDPANTEFFLPCVLRKIDRPNSTDKLFPIQGENWNLGTLPSSPSQPLNQTVASQWALLVRVQYNKNGANLGTDYLSEHYGQAIPNPGLPDPRLQLPQACVSGLDAAWAGPATNLQHDAKTYSGVVPLSVGCYDGTSVKLSGKYELLQNVCLPLRSSPKACAPAPNPAPDVKPYLFPSQDITGGGWFEVDASDVWLDTAFTLSVAGAGTERSLAVDVTSVTVRGSAPGSIPKLVLNPAKLTIDTSDELAEKLKSNWLTAAQTAFGQPDVQQAMIVHLNAELQQPGNMGQLSDVLTEQLAKALDEAVGAVPSGQLPGGDSQADNEVDQYIFDRIRFALSSPDTEYYVPRAVLRISNPPMEPYSGGTVEIGSKSIPMSGVTVQLNEITLSDVEITGLSNMVAPSTSLVLKPNGLTAELDLSTLPAQTITVDGAQKQIPGPPLVAKCKFSAKSPQAPGATLTADIEFRLQASQLLIDATVDGNNLSEMEVKVNSLVLSADPKDISVKVSNLGGGGPEALINSLFNDSAVKKQFLSGLNENVKSERGSIGSDITARIKQLVEDRLGKGTDSSSCQGTITCAEPIAECPESPTWS